MTNMLVVLAVVNVVICSCPGPTGNMTGEQPHIKIGVIANGRNEMETRHGAHVTVVWMYVDVSETFQVFRSVKILDEREDISFIVFLDYYRYSVSNSILATKNKRLIKWTRKPVEGGLLKENNTGDSPVQYPVYCIKNLNSTLLGNAPYDGSSLEATVSNALSQFCKLQKWTSIFIFHDNSTEFETSATIEALSRSGVMSTVYNIDRVEDLNAIMLQSYVSTIAVKQEIKFAVICRYNCVKRILKTANAFDNYSADHRTLLRHFSRWLVVLFDHTNMMLRDLKKIANDLDNIAVMALPEVYFPSSRGFSDALEQTLMSLHDGTSTTSDKHGSVKFTHCDLLQALSLWHPAARCIGFKVDTLLWTHKGREFSPVANVDLAGNVTQLATILPNINNGYSGRQFIVATLPYPPFVIKRQENGTNIYEGTFMQLLEELAATMNFTYKLIEPEDGMWGAFIDQENLIFNGLVGLLQRKECDFVAAPLVIQADRTKVVDFSYTVYHEYSAVLQKKPDPSADKWKTLINPFKMKVHVAIDACGCQTVYIKSSHRVFDAATGFDLHCFQCNKAGFVMTGLKRLSLAFVTVLAFLIERYGQYYQKPAHKSTRQQEGGLHKLHDSFWYMYGALLFQGGVSLPNSLAGRTFISTWWLFCIVVVGIYSGNLIAFLTVTKVQPLFNTLEELVDMKGSIKWGILGGTFWQVIFETSTIPLFREIGDIINNNKASDPGILHIQTDYHVNRVIEGGYAWIGDKTTMELAMAKECDLFVAKEEFLPMKYAYAFQKNSPHTIMFSKQIMNCHEGGLMEMWKRKWWPRNIFCSSEIVPEAKPITVADVQSAFYVCALGTVVGTIAFITERIVKWCKNRKRCKYSEANDE